MKEPNEIKSNTWDILLRLCMFFFLSKYRFWLSSPCSCCLLPSLSLSMSRLSLYHYLTHLLRVSVKGSLVLAVPRLGKKSDNQALKYLWAKQLLLKLTCMFFILYLFKTYSSRERVYFLTVIALIIFFCCSLYPFQPYSNVGLQSFSR